MLKKTFLIYLLSLLFLIVSCGASFDATFSIAKGLPIYPTETDYIFDLQLELNQNIDLFSYLSATDNEGNDVSNQIRLASGFFDPTKAGKYSIQYEIGEGETRSVLIFNITVRGNPDLTDDPPIIIMLNKEGEAVTAMESPDLQFSVGQPFVDPSFIVEDDYDYEVPMSSRSTTYYIGGTPEPSAIISTITTAIPGYYTIRYTALDSSGKSAIAIRFVTVLEKGVAAPELIINPYTAPSEEIGTNKFTEDAVLTEIETETVVIGDSPADPTLELGYAAYQEFGVTIRNIKYTAKGSTAEEVIPEVIIDQDYITDLNNRVHVTVKDTIRLKIEELGRVVAYLQISTLPDELLPLHYEISYLLEPSEYVTGIAPVHRFRKIKFKDDVAPLLSFESKQEIKRTVVKQNSFFSPPSIVMEEKGDFTLLTNQIQATYVRLNADNTSSGNVSIIPQSSDIAGQRYDIFYQVTDWSGNQSPVLKQEIIIVDGHAPFMETVEGFKDEVFFFVGELTKDNLYTKLADEVGFAIYDRGWVEEIDGQIIETTKRLPYWNSIGDRPAGIEESGYFGIQALELAKDDNVNNPGTYYVRYFATDNASALDMKGFVLDENENPENNFSDFVRKIHIIQESPTWANGKFSPYDKVNKGLWLEWDSSPMVTSYQLFYKKYSSDPSTEAEPFMLAGEPLVIDGNKSSYFLETTETDNLYYLERLHTRPDKTIKKTLTSNYLFSLVDGYSPKNATATRNLDGKIELSWDALPYVDGYHIYATTPYHINSFANDSESFYEYKIDEVGKDVTSFVYSQNAPCFDLSKLGIAAMAPDGEYGCPPFEVYFWIEPFVEPKNHGSQGSKVATGDLDFTQRTLAGKRKTDSRELANLALELTYLASKDLLWSDIPWNDYWTASNADEELIHEGSDYTKNNPRDFDFTTNPWRVPSNLKGKDAATSAEYINYTNRLHYKEYIYNGIKGKAIAEAIRAKSSSLPGFNSVEYALSRWWYHDLYFKSVRYGGMEIELDRGWRIYGLKWTNVNDPYLYLEINYKEFGQTSNLHVRTFDKSTDGEYTQIAGPCFNDGVILQISYDNGSNWNNVTYNRATMFSW